MTKTVANSLIKSYKMVATLENDAMLETMAAQQLAYNGYDLRYFDKSKCGEVDFVLPGRRSAMPVEVKSGSNYTRHKALDSVLAVDEWNIQDAFVFCPANVRADGPICDLPWYFLMF